MHSQFSPHQQAGAGPVTDGRHHHLDLIRGAALIGVLLCNLLLGLSRPYDWALLWSKNVFAFPDMASVAAEWLVVTVFRDKSVTLFTMLFAIGLCIQREHIVRKGGNWLAHAGRRLAALFLFGACHVWLVWWGDILHEYALTGAILLVFLGRQNRTLAIWCVFGFLALMGQSLAELGDPLPSQPKPVSQAAIAEIQSGIADKVAGYTQGAWLDVMRFRLMDWMKFLPYDAAYLPVCVTVGLLGVCIWRTGVLKEPARHRRAIVGVTCVALGLGAVLAVLFSLHMVAFQFTRAHWEVWRWLRAFSRVTEFIAGPILAMGYGGALLLASLNPVWAAALKPLNQLGRMAFTNYIMQSVICVVVFEGWGLGLYGKLSPVQTVLLGLLIIAFQLVFSTLWLKRFNFGPLEWIWRCATYWKPVPLSRARPA